MAAVDGDEGVDTTVDAAGATTVVSLSVTAAFLVVLVFLTFGSAVELDFAVLGTFTAFSGFKAFSALGVLSVFAAFVEVDAFLFIVLAGADSVSAEETGLLALFFVVACGVFGVAVVLFARVFLTGGMDSSGADAGGGVAFATLAALRHCSCGNGGLERTLTSCDPALLLLASSRGIGNIMSDFGVATIQS